MSNMEKSLSPDLKRASGAVDLGATNSLFKRAPKMAISRNEMAALGAKASSSSELTDVGSSPGSGRSVVP
jgi:hypothetical protein